VWGRIGKVGKAQFLPGIVLAPAECFGHCNWVRKRIDEDHPVPHQGPGCGQDATLKPYCHNPSASGPLSTSTLQFPHCWLGVAWIYGRCSKRIQDSRRTGENHRWKMILANMYWGRCSPSGVTNPAKTLGISRDCQYRSLRVTALMPDGPLCPPLIGE